MPVFEIQGPDGKTFEVEGPDAATVGAKMKAHFGGQSAPADAPAPSKYDPEEEAYISDRTKKHLAVDNSFHDFTKASQAGTTMGLSGVADRIFDLSTATFDGPKRREGESYLDSVARTYELNREAQERAYNARNARSPIATTAGSIVGGVAGAAMLGGPAGGMSTVALPGRTAAAVAPKTGVGAAAEWLATPAEGGVLANVGKGIVTGAAQGAAVGSAEGSGHAAEGAVGGGIVGGAVPAAIGLGRGAFKVGEGIVRPHLDPKGQAIDLWEGGVAAGGKTPEEVLRRTRREGGAAIPLDYAGESARDLARAATNVPSPGRNRTTTNLNIRQMKANDRVEGSITRNIDDPSTAAQSIGEFIESQKARSNENYTAARQNKQPVNINGTLARIEEISPGIAGHGASNLRPDTTSGKIANVRAMIADTADRENMVDLDRLHLVKEDIDSMIGVADRAGDGTLKGKLVQIKNAMLRDMDATNELYGVARRAHAGDMAVADAYDKGLSYFTNKGGSLTARELADMSVAEKAAFQHAAAKSIKDMVDQSVDGADLAKKVIGSKAKRDALAGLFMPSGDLEGPALAAAQRQAQSRLNDFFKDMMREGRFARTRQSIIGGSTTARQTTNGDQGQVQEVLGIGKAIARGDVGGAIVQAAQRFLARTKGMTPEVANEFLKIASDKSISGEQARKAYMAAAKGRREVYDALWNAHQQFRTPLITGGGSAVRTRAYDEEKR